MKLSKNKLLITGGTKGIGLALVQKFMQLDNEVVVVGRNKVALEAISQIYPTIHTFQCDLSKDVELQQLVVFIENEHPDTNILINNAGVQYNYWWLKEELLTDRIDKEFAVNLLAPVKLTAMLLHTLEENQNAAIVNISSALATVPKIDTVIYSASKAAIHAFSRAITGQLTKVKVFEVVPPLVDTDMTQGRGKGKISPEQLVELFIPQFQRDVRHIVIGKSKLLLLLHRLVPTVAARIINRPE